MNFKQQGAITAQLLVIIGLLILVVGLAGASVWLFTQYTDQKNNVDSKIAVAEAAARKEQAEEDDIKIKKVEEEPNREFAAPEDYGRLSFTYPKNWSVYVADDGTTSSKKYSAYLNPVTVPPVTAKTTRVALEVTIESNAYDKVLASYKTGIEKGELTSSTVSVNGHEGTRLDGLIEKDVRGSAVLFRVRDKTITVASQAETFKEYFDTIIKTIDFND